MRPSRLLVTLVLALTCLTVLLILAVEELAAILMLMWGGLVFLAVIDLMLTLSRRNLTVDIDVPESGFNGLTVPLGIALSVRRGNLPSRFELRLTMDEGLQAGWDAPIRAEDGATDIRLETQLALSARGEKNLNRMSLKYASRLGTVRHHCGLDA